MFHALWSLLKQSGALGGRARRQAKAAKQNLDAAIRHLYRLALLRSPSAAEIKSWANTVGVNTNAAAAISMVNAIATSAEARVVPSPLLARVPHGVLVQHAYEIILQRGARPDEIVSWTHLLDQHPVAIDWLVNTLFRREASSRLHRYVGSMAAKTDTQSNYIGGTNTAITIEDWQNRSDQIKEQTDTAKHRSYSRFPLVSGPGILVSLIASVYNGRSYISQFMENITSQSIFTTHCELIIIDANSPQNEFDVIKPYLDRFDNIRYFRTDSQVSIYEAWNIAISKARGLYITNTNVDDLRRRDSLELQASTLDNLDFIDVVYQDVFHSFDATLTFDEVAAFGFASNMPIVCPNNLLYYNWPHNAPMWRRALHDQVGVFDTSYKSYGDAEFWMRCAIAGRQFYKINDPHVVYFFNPDGISTRPDSPGIEECNQVTRIHARNLVSENLVSPTDQFLEEVCRRSGLSVEISNEDRAREDWRYITVQAALRQISIASRDAARQ